MRPYCIKEVFIIILFMVCSITLHAQNTYSGRFTRSLHDVMETVSHRWNVRFSYDIDTVGLQLPYADFRVKPYSLEETLTGICKFFDFNWWKQNGRLYKIKPFEYPRRHVEEGEQMISWLNSLYQNKEQLELRKDSVRREVRRLLGIDDYLKQLVHHRPVCSKVRSYDGYTVQNICIETLPGEHVFGSIYAPAPDKAALRRWKSAAGVRKWKGYALIICPDGHFNGGRYRKDEQLRLATLARMGAVCVDFDLYGWGESELEYGKNSHRTDRAHVIQALNGLVLLDYLFNSRKDIDRQRIGVNGGSGGGTQTVLLSVLDDRFTAAAPTVSLASHFDGGCPCESGKPIQLAGGGTCNAELAAFFAPKPMLVVSDGGDWTASVPTLEFPYLQRVYGFYDAMPHVTNVHLPKEKHDFGPNKRQAVYDFFTKVFRLDHSLMDESKVTVVAADVLQSHLLNK